MEKTANEWWDEGNSFQNLGKDHEAIRCYDKALEIDPEYAYALNNKAVSLQNLGKDYEAIQYLDKALKIDPEYAYALNNKGLSLLNLGKNHEAIKILDKSLEIDPNNECALNNKGKSLLNLGKEKEAIKYFDKVLELDPNNEFALNNKRYIKIKELKKIIEISTRILIQDLANVLGMDRTDLLKFITENRYELPHIQIDGKFLTIQPEIMNE